MTGFFDGWEEPAGGGSAWISGEEKKKMVAEQTPFTITGVTFDSSHEFQGTPQPRFVLTVKMHSGPEGEVEDRLMGFTEGVMTRDAMLSNMVDYFANNGDKATEPVVYLEMGGRAYLIRNYAGSEAEKNQAPFS